ncbi:hypothetical protein C8F01DRAFT_1059170 [Mycena amicta]|nr:hypothetical protein C8F01DRAFT_1059170 [Mycena amicta]
MEDLATTTSSFRLYNISLLPPFPADAPSCAVVLSSPILCDLSVQSATYDIPGASLASVCTSTCAHSMLSAQHAAFGACGPATLPGPNNSTHLVPLAVNLVAASYTLQCLTDTMTGAFCGTVLSTYTNNDPTRGILGYPQNQLCSSCLLGTVKTTLSSALTFSPPLYQALQAALKICGSTFSSFNLSVPALTPPYTAGASSRLGTTAALPNSGCGLGNRQVTISVAGTCDSVAAQFSVTVMDILTSNPTLNPGSCTTGLAAGASLCLPQPCTLYSMNVNQTCSDVVADVNENNLAAGNNITVVQLQSYNPTLARLCRLGVGSRITSTTCVSPHGGFPDLGHDTPQSPTPTATVAAPGPTAPGTSLTCSSWYQVKPNDLCQRILMTNGITFADFQTLNPQVNGNCDNLQSGLQYCLASYPPLGEAASPLFLSANSTSETVEMLPISTAPSPSPTTTYISETSVPAPPNVFSGTVKTGCSEYYTVRTGDTCASLTDFYGLPSLWPGNPGIICPNLPVGSAICIATFFNPCDFGLSLTPLERAFNSATKKHFYTSNDAEMKQVIATGGFTFEEESPSVFTSQLQFSVPLLHLTKASIGGHFYTILQSEANTAIANGYAMAGITAYVYPTQLCGSTPIYHVFNPSTSDDFYTSFLFEKTSAQSSGYTTDKGIAFFTL